MRTTVTKVGKLSDFFFREEKEDGTVEFKTQLEGKQIKLSRRLMAEIESEWHPLYPKLVDVKVEKCTINCAIWRRKDGFVSRIVLVNTSSWGKKNRGKYILGGTPQSNKETVVITSLD